MPAKKPIAAEASTEIPKDTTMEKAKPKKKATPEPKQADNSVIKTPEPKKSTSKKRNIEQTGEEVKIEKKAAVSAKKQKTSEKPKTELPVNTEKSDATTREAKSKKVDNDQPKDRYHFDAPDGPLTEAQKKQRAYLLRMKKINRTPRRMKKGKNRHIRCDQGKPTGRSTPWANALKAAKLELNLPIEGVMIFPRVGTDLHTTAIRIMNESKKKNSTEIVVN